MRKADIYKLLFITLTVIVAIAVSACSSKEVTNRNVAEGGKFFTFYSSADGAKYEVAFDKNNNITSLIKNGKNIPEEEYDKYKETIFNELDEVSGKENEKRRHVYRFDSDRKVPDLIELPGFEEGEFNDQELESEIIIRSGEDSTTDRKVYRFRGEFPKIHKEIWHKWNDSTFNEDMKRMKEEVAKLKDVKIKLNFDSDEFHKQMEILRKEIRTNLNETLKDLNEDIKEITRELKDKKFDELKEIEVDIPDIEVELKNLDRKMENLDKEMSKVKVEMKKLDGFMKDIRSELYKDKLIESEDEDFSLVLKAQSMKVNDEEIPSNLLPKYKEMYKKHFGKEMKGTERFNIEN